MARRRAIGVVIVLVVAAVAAWGYVRHRCRIDPFFCAAVHGSCELSQDRIREAFRRMSERDLPEAVRNARAVLLGGHEGRIFVRFDTDANGVASVERMFATPQAKCETFDGPRLTSLVASGWMGFPEVAARQDRSGTRMFSPAKLGRGRWITFESGDAEGWEVYIDSEHSTVYIYYWPYT